MILTSPSPPSPHESFAFVVQDDEAGTRLDRFLTAQEQLTCSRSYLQRLIANEQVKVDGNKPRASMKLKSGALVELHLPPPNPLALQPQDIPLSVAYEDEHLIVIDKPAGMVVHPGAGHPDGTLVNALLHHCHDLSGIGGTLRPGIVHRLDRFTSGLLVAAKHDRAHQGLADLFREKPKEKIQRRYQAIVQGPFREEHGLIDTPHGRHPTQRLRFSSKVESSRRAITEFWVRERFSWVVLLELRLETGRTHQIRVHMADRQRPLLGDALYGPKKQPSTWPRFLRECPRQALHAFHLSFVHPVTEERITCEAPLPKDLQSILESLRKLQP